MNILDFDFGSKTIVYSISDSFFQKCLKCIAFSIVAIRVSFWETRLPSFDQELDVFQQLPETTVIISDKECRKPPKGTDIAQRPLALLLNESSFGINFELSSHF